MIDLGTGDGRLFAFWPDPVAGGGSQLSELSKTTGQIVAQTNVPIGEDNNAFAFAFWGGDFWFYTSEGPTPSRVTRLTPATGQVAVAMEDVGGFRIVGAGVSTCAPTTSPK